MCRQEGFSEEKVLKLCTPLCEDFRDKNYGASKDAHMPQTEDEITEDKLADRDIFFMCLRNLLTNLLPYSISYAMGSVFCT